MPLARFLPMPETTVDDLIDNDVALAGGISLAALKVSFPGQYDLIYGLFRARLFDFDDSAEGAD